MIDILAAFDATSDKTSEKMTELSAEAQRKANSVHDLTVRFHKVHSDVDSNEPDWEGLLLQETSGHKKMDIINARNAYKLEQKARNWEEQKKSFEQKVDGILATPSHLRNKEFYDILQKNDRSIYFHTRIQKQRIKDRENLGLSYHLKTRG